MTELIKIRLNNDELWTAMSALEFLMRMHLGQYDEINWYLRLNSGNLEKDEEVKEKERYALLSSLRNIILPDLAGINLSGSYGIYGGKVNPAAVDAYDLLQTIRYAESWYRVPEGGTTVNFSPPHIAGKFPKAEVIMSGKRSMGSAKINLDIKQVELMKEAAILYHHLTEQNFEELFRTLSGENEAVNIIASHLNETKIDSVSKTEARKVAGLVNTLNLVLEYAPEENHVEDPK